MKAEMKTGGEGVVLKAETDRFGVEGDGVAELGEGRGRRGGTEKRIGVGGGV